MTDPGPRTGPRHEPERTYERAADPAEAVDRPLEPKSSQEPLNPTDDPPVGRDPDEDPHHRLNVAVGEPDVAADSDPYRPASDDEDADRASGTSGAHQGAER